MSRATDFTVVMPVYNGEKYIAESLNSVLAQTYPPAQVIVVDDGSSDDTARIVEGYGSQVQLVRQANQGQSAARNRGVSLAKTEWISFSDQDDLWLSHHLEEQARAIEQQPDADLCYAANPALVIPWRCPAQTSFPPCCWTIAPSSPPALLSGEVHCSKWAVGTAPLIQ